MESELSFLKQIHLKSSEEYICNTVKDDEGNYAKDKWCELCRPFVI